MVPGAFLYWFSVHPFVRFWRRVGARRTLAIHYVLILLLAAAIFMVRRPLLAVDFGTNPVLIAVAVPLFAICVAGRVVLSKQLKNRILAGLPELAPEAYGSRLLTEGVYARVRHPRYAQVVVQMLAFALFTNYLATYVLFLLVAAALFPLTRIEERELRDRFGAEYEAYCARVPRFIPKF
jgi:protein-S-isoprenylcysteine O-methyltransferase Ste14